jgi:hypothetical protein
MSRIIPQRTVDAFRKFNDVSVYNFGIPCTLFVANNNDLVDTYDIYRKPSDFTYDSYSADVFIEWSPNKYRLRKLGIYTEDELPVLCWFSNRMLDGQQQEVDVDIVIGSYYRIEEQFMPDKVDYDEFEIVDVIIRGMHEKSMVKLYKCAPRRVKS